jgi:hypothetical protein
VKSFAWQPGAGNDRLAYIDMQTFLRFELYVVRFDGTLHQQVHPEAQIWAGRSSPRLGPDGTYVAFLADSSPTARSSCGRIASSNGAANSSASCRRTPRAATSRPSSGARLGPRLSYVADEDIGGRFELFVSNFNGGLHAAST